METKNSMFLFQQSFKSNFLLNMNHELLPKILHIAKTNKNSYRCEIRISGGVMPVSSKWNAVLTLAKLKHTQHRLVFEFESTCRRYSEHHHKRFLEKT